MGEQDPYETATTGTQDVVEVDTSPDLDELGSDVDAPHTPSCRVNPQSILEALLFVGLPEGQPLSSERVASLMREFVRQKLMNLLEILLITTKRMGARTRLCLREQVGCFDSEKSFVNTVPSSRPNTSRTT